MTEPREHHAPEVDIRVTGTSYGRSRVAVLVDGAEIAVGDIGGEAEDNCIARDYAWLPGALSQLAEALGADVTLLDEVAEDGE